MKISDVTDEQLKGWKYSITRNSKCYDVLFQHQYRAVVTTPSGDYITSMPFLGTNFNIYAFTDKGAEKKVVKTIKRLIVQEYNEKNPINKSL